MRWNFGWTVFGILLITYGLYAQQAIDVTKRPEPGPLTAVRFPAFQTLTLSNGLKVFVVEDHEQPTIAFRVQIGIGSIADPPGKAGAMEMLVDMLTKGTKTRSALDIAQALDSIGASLTTSAGGDAMYVVASGLKKYSGQILSVLADILQHPTFPESELQKYKQQVIAVFMATITRMRKALRKRVSMPLQRRISALCTNNILSLISFRSPLLAMQRCRKPVSGWNNFSATGPSARYRYPTFRTLTLPLPVFISSSDPVPFSLPSLQQHRLSHMHIPTTRNSG